LARDDWKNEKSLGFAGSVDPAFVAFVLRWVRPIVRALMRPRLEGGEHLSSHKPYLLVGNHSGLGDAELVALMVVLLERFGTTLPIAGMVHPLSFRGKRRLMEKVGAIPSTYEAALAALKTGVPVLVFPGGDHEAMRPVWQAYRVDFANRKGFLKIAQAARVPVVPMGIRGSHFVAPVLWRSNVWLARLLVVPALQGIKRYPLTLSAILGLAAIAWVGAHFSWPWFVILAAAWVWLVLPLNRLPWVPCSMRVRVGAPIAPESLFPDASSDPDLAEAYARVLPEVQALVARRT
jgi:1-acyl-sn-glycerol-3-phosphate acyltransferase